MSLTDTNLFMLHAKEKNKDCAKTAYSHAELVQKRHSVTNLGRWMQKVSIGIKD